MPWMQAKMHGICHHNSKASEKVAFTTKLGGNVLFILPLQTSVETNRGYNNMVLGEKNLGQVWLYFFFPHIFLRETETEQRYNF